MRPKDQGTKAETDVVRHCHLHNLQAWRLAEGGIKDAGDVAVKTRDGDHWILEVKHREALSPHQTLRLACNKVEKADLPFAVAGTALVWKRSTSRGEGKRRVPQGTVVVLTLSDFLNLLHSD
jgi:hypothetical protein